MQHCSEGRISSKTVDWTSNYKNGCFRDLICMSCAATGWEWFVFDNSETWLLPGGDVARGRSLVWKLAHVTAIPRNPTFNVAKVILQRSLHYCFQIVCNMLKHAMCKDKTSGEWLATDDCQAVTFRQQPKCFARYEQGRVALPGLHGSMVDRLHWRFIFNDQWLFVDSDLCCEIRTPCNWGHSVICRLAGLQPRSDQFLRSSDCAMQFMTLRKNAECASDMTTLPTWGIAAVTESVNAWILLLLIHYYDYSCYCGCWCHKLSHSGGDNSK